MAVAVRERRGCGLGGGEEKEEEGGRRGKEKGEGV